MLFPNVDVSKKCHFFRKILWRISYLHSMSDFFAPAKASSWWNVKILASPNMATSETTRVILQGASCHIAVTPATPWKALRCSLAWGGRGGPGTALCHFVLVSQVINSSRSEIFGFICQYVHLVILRQRSGHHSMVRVIKCFLARE